MQMADGQLKRYLAIIQLKADTPLADLARRVPGLQRFISELSNGEMEQAFRSPEGHIFGVFFKSKKPEAIIRSVLDQATGNGDGFLVFEAGSLAATKMFGRPATWLQHH